MAKSPTSPRQSGRRRCAIYTRKSSEEGLEQEFNSLHAQREACEAYVASQRHEGWTLVHQHYDDGGFSGGSMERPALRELIADIEAGRVDVVLVYKVDRLTRALSDFAKLVDVFDKRQVSFVSITQQFNTTTSMGRLTLNVLLSFAQFEREVIGERIRDKIAASKRKGMWMGGMPPLGYDVRDRKLAVDAAEAVTVEAIFRRYLALRSVHALRDELADTGVVSKQRRRPDGSAYGGQPLGSGALYAMLQNRLYRGEITHKGDVHPGEHAAIIDQTLWDQVQEQLAQNRHEHRQGKHTTHPNLLAGILFDAARERLSPTYALKRGMRYRYYVSAHLIRGKVGKATKWRVPAADLEIIVVDRLRSFLRDSPAVLDAIATTTNVANSRVVVEASHLLAERLGSMSIGETRSILSGLGSSVVLHPGRVDLHVCASRLAQQLAGAPMDAGKVDGGNRSRQFTLDDDQAIVLSVNATLRRAAREMRIVVDTDSPPAAPDPSLLRLVARAHELQERLDQDPELNVAAIAQRENVTSAYLYTLLRVRWLAPDIVTALVEGRQPTSLTATTLMRQASRLPVAWDEQRVTLGLL